MNQVVLESVDRVEVTILMDTVTDPLLVDEDGKRRVNWLRALNGAFPTAAPG
jgi:hypothetical protein